MKRLILLVVLLCGTALWPIRSQPAHSSIAFGPDLVLRRDAANTLVPRDSVPQEWRIYDAYIDALHYIGRKSNDLGRTWQPLLSAQEVASLTTPETKPSNTQYAIERITETVDDPATPADEGVLVIQLTGLNHEAVSCVYNATTTPTATVLINGQNKANFSTAYAGNATTGSRRQRIFHRLVVMGESTAVCGKTITGTVAGVVP